MPPSPWDQPSFWDEKSSWLKAAARGWPSVDWQAPIGEIWLKLKQRYPRGCPETATDLRKLDSQIRSIARRHHRNDAFGRRTSSGKAMLPIESVEELSAATKSPESEVIAQEAAAAILSKLKPKEREIMESRYGVGRPERSSDEIAKDRHISRQAVLKQLRKSTDKIRRQTTFI